VPQEAFLAVLDSVPASRREDPSVVPGWSVKDLICHNAAWAAFAADELEPIVSSTDPNFRPSDLKVGPDGALYFIDWHNPIIGHMQRHLRDPSRDHTHGRIYRITYEGRPLSKPPKIAGEPNAQIRTFGPG
jgi:hypothetical protein